MADHLQFQRLDPKKDGDWIGVAIFLNGVELTEILRDLEAPYAIDEGHPDLAGDYGHQTPEELYQNLTAWEEEVPLLCCAGCGMSGCWSILVDIQRDDAFVYWTHFRQNHREHWDYDLSYQFPRSEYEAQLEQLRLLTTSPQTV